MSPLRAALVIARRDYVASVWSRTFLLFLIGPLLPLIAVGLFATVGATGDRAPPRPVVTIVATPDDAAAIGHAHAALGMRLGPAILPGLRVVVGDEPDDVPPSSAVLTGGLDKPVLTGPPGAIEALRQPVALVLDRARADRVLARIGPEFVPPPVEIATRAVKQPPRANPDDRLDIARFGQIVLMFLTMLLTGLMTSNMVEEKSNKVIEVLTAAVPVDGIFYGKLIAMLGLSLTGIAAWGSMGGLAFLFASHGGATLPPPAVGWPMFLLLGLAYFCAVYLLFGAVFLGIGAQAASMREVQTVSMPLTMAQLGIVAFTSSVLGRLDEPAGIAASIFPWSSPYAMLARAAEQDALWPHALAILWQAGWVVLTVALVSRWFRVSVLKSGRPGRLKRLFRRNRREATPV